MAVYIRVFIDSECSGSILGNAGYLERARSVSIRSELDTITDAEPVRTNIYLLQSYKCATGFIS